MNLREVVEAANALSRLLEAPRKGLRHQRHTRHLAPARRAVAAVLRRYWARQEAALLREVEPRIESTLASFPRVQEAASIAGRRLAANILPTSLHPLSFPVSDEVSEYDTAITNAILGAGRVLAAELASGTVMSPNVASRYLRDNSLSKLTGGLDETSLDRLREAIASAWDRGGSYDQIVGAIRDTFSDFSETRAGLVAQTEVNDAYSEGRRQMADDMGMDEHAWETESGDPCDECLGNEAQGWIPIEDAFESGDDSPTAHPGCACGENFRKSSGPDD